MVKLSLDYGSDDTPNIFTYDKIFHGSYHEVKDVILKDGLCRMARNNIHMAIGLPEDGVISGMRKSSEVVYEINISKAASSGVDFFVSDNGVILTPGIGDKGMLPPSYFRSAFYPSNGEYFFESKIKYICVYDFECNYSENKGDLPELIRFAVVIIDCETQEIV